MRTIVLSGLATTLGAGCISLRPYSDVAAGLAADSLLEVDGRRIHVDARGEGFPLLLLHGFGASTLLWEPVLPALAQHRRTVAIDLYGFGWTERPRDPAAYTLEGQEQMILAVADELGFERFDLAGHSYGGAIALFLTSRHPERVRSLVLVDNAMPKYAAERRWKRYGSRALARFYVRTLGLSAARVRRGLEESYANDAKITPELVRAHQERLQVEGVEDAFYGLTAPSSEPPFELDLATLEVPTLVVWGEDDTLIRADDARRSTTKLPRGRFVGLPDCGHVPTMECPEAFVAAVTPFLLDSDLGAGLPASKR